MKFLNFIKQRWFISLLGVIGLSLFIWYVGPLLAFSHHEPLAPETPRLILIALIVGCWVLLQTWTYFKAKKQNNQVLAAMTNAQSLSPNEQATQEELQTLQERLQEALTTLKKVRLGGQTGRQFLYQLPWYIIIGPPGSGKSTLLKTSDLKFPLSDQYGKEAIRGVGGTRNCDWWFTDEAVLLDTAGRYTTQDSQKEIDQNAWLGFLDLLKKYRPRRPINGAIIAISIEELLKQDRAEQKAHAVAIRKRLQELHDKFGIRFPVYVVLNKCDLLAGFMEYFDDIDRDKRAQVWGMTFKLDENTSTNSIEQFSNEFDLLSQRLQSHLIDKLERERGGERRNYIYTFPQQFNSLKELVQPFLQDIFQATRYEHTTQLRGVYFTSATQEGSPIDRIMGTLANSFGLERQNLANTNTQGKSFFINHLLSQVIFAESGLAGANLKLENQRIWLQRGAFLSVIGLTSLMALLWGASFINNKAYISTIAEQSKALEQEVSKVNPEQSDPLMVLALLDKARNLPGGYADRLNGSGWNFGLGLSQKDKLGDAAIALYRKLLKELFLSRLMVRIEQQLQSNANNSDYLYEALKVYLMLNDEEHFKADAVRDWFSTDWKHNLALNVTNTQRQTLAEHLNALLEVQPLSLPRPLSNDLIQQTRGILQRTSLADRVYARLKLELANNDIKNFVVSENAGRDALLVLASKSNEPLTKSIPGFFTCAGYQDVFLKNNDDIINQQAGDNWIIGTEQKTNLTEAEIKQLHDEVLKKYLEEYIQQWDRLMADIQLKPFSNQAQMVEILGIVSSESSPLRLFLQAVDRETSFACLAEKNKSLLAKADNTLDKAKSALDKIMSSTSEAQTSGAPQLTTNLVTEHFRDLHELVLSKDGSATPLDRSLTSLNELYIYLNSLSHATGEELVLDQRKQVIAIIDKVKLEGKRNRFALVNNLITDVADGSNSLVSGGIQKHLNDVWKAEVVPFCQKAIQGLYPIANSNREITYEDFSHFFGPGGLMDEYFKKYLAASVDKTSKQWQWLNRGEANSGVSANALRQFQIANDIKEVFFRTAKDVPTVNFKLKPISMSETIEQFTLDVDGQTLTYAHGPQQPIAMKWPGPNNAGQVQIQLLPPTEGGSGLSKEGPWALFRMFEAAKISKTADPTVFIMTFNLQGRQAKFELNANSAINPFQLSELQSFKCLPNL